MVTSVKNLSAAVTVLNKELGSTARLLKNLVGYSKGIKGLTSSIKSLSSNLGSSNKIFDDSASFSEEVQKGASGVRGAQASSAVQREQTSNTKMPWLQTKKGAGVVGGAQVALGVAAAGYAGLPDTGTVIGRAAGFYSGAVMGGVNQQRLRQAVFSGLAGGITNPGDDVAAAAMLIQGYKYAPNSAAFNMRVREIGGAARYLNISNPVAAEALGQLGTGSMSGNLAQYGIFTSDPKTGKDLGFEQVARQIYNRFYGGKKVSREQVLTDVRSGFLGADLRQLGFSDTQQELFINAFGNFAEGKRFDLGNLQGKDNPYAAQLQMATSQTALMEDATKPMIKGFQQAADVVTKFNKAMERMPESMVQFKAFLQTTAGTNVGGATGSLFAGLSAAFQTVTGAAAFRYLWNAGKTVTEGASTATRGIMASGGEAVSTATSRGAISSATNVLGKTSLLSKVLGPLGIIGTFDMLSNPFDAINPNKISDPNQSFLDQILHGTKYINKPKGGGTTGFGASFGAKGGGSAQSPAPGIAPTSGFGAKDTSGIWSGTNNTHKGQDYPMPVGSEVKAALDGTVFDDAPGYEYGITVQIDHENGFQTLYGHLSQALVKPGDKVKKGQVIGKSGDTGNVTGPHLHFEVRKGANNPVDPQELLSSPFGNTSALLGYSPQTNTVQKSPTTSGAQSVGVSPSGNKKEWITSFLSSIGAPQTKDNIYAMSEWIRFESGNRWNRWNNPLNTTLNRSGAKSMNSVGVKMYGSSSEGLEATIATLTGNRADQRGYTAILDSLRSGADYTKTFDAIRASAWVGGEEKRSPYQFNYQKGPSGGGRTGFGASVPTSSPSVTGNRTVNVTLNIQQASEEEAIRFARRIKHYIESDNDLLTMGSK